jgi:anti-anti-sigma regulatory factor
MLAAPKRITLDLSLTRHIDARFIGLLMMLRKLARERATQLQIVGASPQAGLDVGRIGGRYGTYVFFRFVHAHPTSDEL